MKVVVDSSAFILARRNSRASLCVVLSAFVRSIEVSQPLSAPLLGIVVKYARWRLRGLESDRSRKPKAVGLKPGRPSNANKIHAFLCAVSSRKTCPLRWQDMEPFAKLVAADIKSGVVRQLKSGPASCHLYWFELVCEVLECIDLEGMTEDCAFAHVAAEGVLQPDGKRIRAGESTVKHAYERFRPYFLSCKNDSSTPFPSHLVFD